MMMVMVGTDPAVGLDPTRSVMVIPSLPETQHDESK
jgi:hypothetical protein